MAIDSGIGACADWTEQGKPKSPENDHILIYSHLITIMVLLQKNVFFNMVVGQLDFHVGGKFILDPYPHQI